MLNKLTFCLTSLLKIAFYFYRPKNIVCEGYVFTSVCLSTGGGGGLVTSSCTVDVSRCGGSIQVTSNAC